MKCGDVRPGQITRSVLLHVLPLYWWQGWGIWVEICPVSYHTLECASGPIKQTDIDSVLPRNEKQTSAAFNEPWHYKKKKTKTKNKPRILHYSCANKPSEVRPGFSKDAVVCCRMLTLQKCCLITVWWHKRNHIFKNEKMMHFNLSVIITFSLNTTQTFNFFEMY